MGPTQSSRTTAASASKNGAAPSCKVFPCVLSTVPTILKLCLILNKIYCSFISSLASSHQHNVAESETFIEVALQIHL